MVAEEVLPLQRPASGDYDRKVAREMRDLESDIIELQGAAAMLAYVLLDAGLKSTGTADCLELPPLLGNAVVASSVDLRDRASALYERWHKAQSECSPREPVEV